MCAMQHDGYRDAEPVSWAQRLDSTDLVSREYQELKFTLHRKLLDRINLEALSSMAGDRMRAEIRVAVAKLVDEERVPLNSAEKDRVVEEVLDELFGLGPLEVLLQDASVTFILVSGHNQVLVERNGQLEATSIQFRDDAHLSRIIGKVTAHSARRVDESNPLAEETLSDGSRATVILPPLAVDGPVLSIRCHRARMLASDDLIEGHSLTEDMMTFLEAAVKARLNIIVSGGAGTGKTTVLNALCSFTSQKERIMTIEERVQLQCDRPFMIRLLVRGGKGEGPGNVGQRQLLLSGLRAQPDRVVIGELRGPEVADLFQEVRLSARSFLATVQANSPQDAIDRLEAMMSSAGPNISMRSIHQSLVAAVNLVVHVSRFHDGSHRVTQITEVVGLNGDMISLRDVFLFDSRSSEDGRMGGNFRALGMTSRLSERIGKSGVQLPPRLFEVSDGESSTSQASIERLLPVLARVVAVFGDEQESSLWLSTPLSCFDDRSPQELLTSEEGIARVEELLARIERSRLR